jgi:DNA adenine methylase
MPSLDWYDCPVVIPYYGGKYEMSKRLIPLIPPHERYFEVFAGGLSMFFRKKKAKWNVLNDIDRNIVNLYTCVLEEYDELAKYLFWLPKSRELFVNYRDEIKEERPFKIPDPYQAAKYFYSIRYSFNKLIHTPFAMNKDLKKDFADELRYSREFIGGATIENLDFAELVTRYKTRANDFWYLDPPYFVATEKAEQKRDYYMNTFNADDHLRMKESVDIIHQSGAKFMVSYDHREEVYELYKEYNVQTINIVYAGATDENRHKKRQEYVITNYEANTQVDMFGDTKEVK